LSIPLRLRPPLLWPPDVRQVDTVEEHRELGGIQLGSKSVIADCRKSKAALFKPLVGDHEATRIPGENLQPVPPTRNENEKMAGVNVLFPC
jgi:hypothetical protein